MTKDRDAELDEIQSDLQRPFVHRPDELDNGPGSLCWLDGSRRCGPDCVAFDASAGLDENGLPVDDPEKCSVLGRLGGVGHVLADLVSLKKRAEKRTEAPSMPTPPTVGRKG